MYQVLGVGKIHSFIINQFKLSVLIKTMNQHFLFIYIFAHHSKTYAIKTF